VFNSTYTKFQAKDVAMSNILSAEREKRVEHSCETSVVKKWHGVAPNDDELNKALAELEKN